MSFAAWLGLFVIVFVISWAVKFIVYYDTPVEVSILKKKIKKIGIERAELLDDNVSLRNSLAAKERSLLVCRSSISEMTTKTRLLTNIARKRRLEIDKLTIQNQKLTNEKRKLEEQLCC